MVCARTKQTEQTEQTIEIYALAIAFARTNVPLSSERTWTLFHRPQNILDVNVTHATDTCLSN